MATSLEKLERNLDRLEKFFLPRRRKPVPLRDPAAGDSRSSTPPALSSLSAHSVELEDFTLQTFPSPSFIRPKCTRMLARDEITMSPNSNCRAQSLPDPQSVPDRSSVASSADVAKGSYSRLLDQFPRIPQRASSLRTSSLKDSGLGDISLAELFDFSFSEKPEKSIDDSVWSSRSGSGTGSGSGSRSCASLRSSTSATRRKEQALYQLREGNTAIEIRRPDTPPPSAKEEQFLPSTTLQLNKTLPPVPPYGNPTPEPSPRLVPQMIEEAGKIKDDMTSKPRRWRSLAGPDRNVKVVVATLRRSQSDSSLSESRLASKAREILKEPSVTEFLSLSDDDIADGRPVTPPQDETTLHSHSVILPSKGPLPVSPPPRRARRPLLTLSSPLSTRPATAAAFEAARIAGRYKFDLVYAVNLWPDHIGCSQDQSPSRHASLSSHGSPAKLSPSPSLPSNALRDLAVLDNGNEGHGALACMSPHSGMTGRLLAAYGLPGVMSPFRISAPVHLKVLRSQGWLEFRRENAGLDEFARGYSCAFYNGCSPEGSPQKSSACAGEEHGRNPTAKLADRGIVFAAYRLPRADGTTVGSSEVELQALYQDAETLVEMLIDIHVAQRRRRETLRPQAFSEEVHRRPIETLPLLTGR